MGWNAKAWLTVAGIQYCTCAALYCVEKLCHSHCLSKPFTAYIQCLFESDKKDSFGCIMLLSTSTHGESPSPSPSPIKAI